MKWVHEDADFQVLINAAAQATGLDASLVEKDYWVTHTLSVLQESGLDVWFKGGTSLSKSYGLIQRFSEDLDLKIGPGARTDLPAVSSWKKDSTGAKASREGYWRSLVQVLGRGGLDAELDPDLVDSRWMGANIRVSYPGTHLHALPVDMKPYVMLEVGDARVTPSLARDMTSFVHDELARQNLLGDYRDNRPRGVHAVHPLVTLLEKLDAIQQRTDQNKAAAAFVRHYEDAAQIIGAGETLPPLTEYASVAVLAGEMVDERQLVRGMPRADSRAFNPDSSERWNDIRSAHARIERMFWGPRIPLDVACERIRRWIENNLPAAGS